jgi:hypothetical protein
MIKRLNLEIRQIRKKFAGVYGVKNFTLTIEFLYCLLQIFAIFLLKIPTNYEIYID